VLPLADVEPVQFVLAAIAAGNSPGRMGADDDSAPTCAVVYDDRSNVYLVGTADDDLAGAAAQLLAAEVLPPTRARGQDVFLLTCTPPGAWERLGAILPAHRAYARAFHRMARAPWHAPPPALPGACSIRSIDATLLGRSAMPNLVRLHEEIEQCWASVADFLRVGFGYCLVHEETLACWCTGEYFSAGRCGLGIETVEAFQGRGYATATARAFVEHCRRVGTIAHWDAWLHNEPSIRTAERLGFERVATYDTFICTLASDWRPRVRERRVGTRAATGRDPSHLVRPHRLLRWTASRRSPGPCGRRVVWWCSQGRACRPRAGCGRSGAGTVGGAGATRCVWRRPRRSPPNRRW
jgi:RimJ/RimL family protein N-acetyltransferase